jgi:hypothetical protein
VKTTEIWQRMREAAVAGEDVWLDVAEVRALLRERGVEARPAASTGMTAPQRQAMQRVVGEVTAERERQHAKWGEQNHPDGTGYYDPSDDGSMHGLGYMDGQAREEARDAAREECERAFRDGRGTYRHILAEEVAEAFAESGPAKLRAELVQVAAVAVAWVEKIDRDLDDTCNACGRPNTDGCDHVCAACKGGNRCDACDGKAA